MWHEEEDHNNDNNDDPVILLFRLILIYTRTQASGSHIGTGSRRSFKRANSLNQFIRDQHISTLHHSAKSQTLNGVNFTRC